MRTLVGTPDPEPLPNGVYRVFVITMATTSGPQVYPSCTSTATWTPLR